MATSGIKEEETVYVDEMDAEGGSDTEIMPAPSLYGRSVFFRQTRKKGKIFKTVNETYVRDDLGLGSYFVDDAVSRSKRRVKDAVVGKPKDIETPSQLVQLLHPNHPLVVVDTNVLLHNLDVLEQQEAAPNLVVPQTALLECRANQLTAYDRTVELMRAVGDKRVVIFFADQHHADTAGAAAEQSTASVNDKNDARLRSVAEFYGRHLKGTKIQVIHLTDDADSRRKAEIHSDVYKAMSVRNYVLELERKDPNLSLLDLVAQYHVKSTDQGTRKQYFQPHIEALELSRGVQSGKYHRGVLRSSSESQAMVTIRKGEERVAVSVQGRGSRNRAVDGDVVAIALNPLDEWIKNEGRLERNEPREDTSAGIADETAEPTHAEIHNVSDSVGTYGRPTGKVVGIIRRNFSTYCGSIYSKGASKGVDADREEIAKEHQLEHTDGSTTCVFFPVDSKVPPILIRTTQRRRLGGQRIVVSIDSWPSTSPYPLGHYVRTIGKAGSKDVETEVLLHQHKIPHEPFPAKVLACLPPEDYKIDTENSPDRTDLRHLPVLSIDPPGCKDIDDALHCIELSNGNYQVGVHIADVTHYVQAGTAIDVEAANRSTSTYLVNKRLDMLPGLLTTDLCSLKGNVDRYAFSVLWEVTRDADIVAVNFKKTIIHSIGALTYQQAQAMIDQPDDEDDVQACAVKGLAALARKLRKRRIDAGALTLASPEVKFVLDSESLNPTDVQAYTLHEANAVVEEFMLFANVTVAKKILRHYPTLSVLRRHPSPNRSMFDSLISKARCRGFDIDIEDSKRLADSLDAAVLDSDPYFNKLLRILSTRCMSPAQYFCSGEYKPSDWHHYGLAAPVYAHFTSPIRRYADVCVHRLLAAAIGVAPLPVHLSSKSYLHNLAANMNRRHRSAQMAGRDSVQLHTLLFFAGDGAKEEDAYVLDVDTTEASQPSFSVLIPRYGIEGRVKLTAISPTDEELVRLPEKHCIRYKGLSVQVFDKVQVKIWVRELEDFQRELVVDLVEPKFGEEENKARKHQLSGSKKRHSGPTKRSRVD